MDNNKDIDFEVFHNTGKITKKYELPIHECRGKEYIEITPLIVDVGSRYEEANEFRVNGISHVKAPNGR